MSSTYTSSLAIQLMGTGDQSGTWGATTNNNMTYLEEGISGYLYYPVDTTNAVTLNLTQGGDTSPSARNMIINLTNGGASAGVTMTVPGTASKLYFIWNQTGQTVTVQGTTPAATVTIPNAAQTVVFCDGTNNIYAALGALNLNSLTVSTFTATTSITGGTISASTIGCTTITASTQFNGPGTGLTGTASGLSIGGNAATATSATSATSATTATNVSGGTATLTGTSTTNTFNIGYLEVPQNANPTLASDTYTTLATDSGKHIYYSNTSTFSATGVSTASTTAISAAATNSGGTRTQFTFTTPGFTFAAGALITLSGMSVTAYNGTYAVISATTTTVIVAVAFSATSTGTLNYCLLTISAATGTLYQYQGLSGTSFSSATYVSARQSGTGGSGTYHIYPLQSVASTAVIGGPIYVIPTATYNTGTVLTFVNDGSTTAPVSIQTADTVFSAGSGYINPNGVHVLAQYGQATFLKVGSTRWQLSGAGIV